MKILLLQRFVLIIISDEVRHQPRQIFHFHCLVNELDHSFLANFSAVFVVLKEKKIGIRYYSNLTVQLTSVVKHSTLSRGKKILE